MIVQPPPNTRMQRTRSSPSALRSPLMRCPLGRRVALFMAAGLGVAIACARQPTLAPASSKDQMRSSVEALVPVGTAVAVAQEKMVREGFGCEVKRDASFDGREKGDFLYCVRSDGAGASVQRRWQIAFALQNGRVAGVALNQGLVGP